MDQFVGHPRESGYPANAPRNQACLGGYPDHQAGEAIPRGARIVFACDSFDAMTSGRCYRPGRPSEDALAELRHCSGTQFDPEVVDAVVAVVEERLTAAAPVA